MLNFYEERGVSGVLLYTDINAVLLISTAHKLALSSVYFYFVAC